MSAWYVFSALGFYPLQMGSPTYAIGSPLFRQATVHLQNGRDLVIDAPNDSQKNVYVQGVTVNGQKWGRSYFTQDQLAQGGHIEFAMGPKPSSWGTSQGDAPPSITKGTGVPHPMEDAARPEQGVPAASAGADADKLFDDTSGTQATVGGTAPWVGFDFDAPRRADFYTLTSGSGAATEDPGDWVLKGSDDGQTWSVLDRRAGESFRWRSQTRPFQVSDPGAYRHYRIEFTRPGTVTLAEVELLSKQAVPANPISATAPTVTGRAGGTAAVPVTVHNGGDSPVSGQLTSSAPAGWTTSPDSAPFGPIPAGGSQTVTVDVAIPAGAAEGSYPVKFTATTPAGAGRVTGTVQVIGNTIEFTPGTDAEKPWLIDPDGSQLDGAIHDGHGRYADGGTHFTYRFDVPADVNGGSLELEIGNEYVVDVSNDGQSWRTVLKEPTEEHDLNNLDRPHTLDLAPLLNGTHTLYVRVGDAKTDDGWGGWLGHLKITMAGS
jgi:hypothetical protein